MSSIKQLDRQSAPVSTDADEGGAWVRIRSPRTARANVSASDVMDAIGRARLGYRRGVVTETTYTELPDFGGGDPELAADIESAVSARWDD
jgi:hypothetical protein